MTDTTIAERISPVSFEYFGAEVKIMLKSGATLPMRRFVR